MNGPESPHPGLVRSCVTAASHFGQEMSREPGGGQGGCPLIDPPGPPPSFPCKLLNLCTITYDITFEKKPSLYNIHYTCT